MRINNIMLQLRDLPSPEILKKFEQRYPQADVDSIIIFLRLLRVTSDLSTALDQYLFRHGLLQGRWWVMILLMREENFTLTPSALAEKAGVSRATMTRLIDGLERDDLVIREFDENDRRSFSVTLTQIGQKKLDDLMPDYYRRVNECMQAIGEQRYQQLHDLLDAVQAGISAFD